MRQDPRARTEQGRARDRGPTPQREEGQGGQGRGVQGQRRPAAERRQYDGIGKGFRLRELSSGKEAVSRNLVTELLHISA